MKYQLSVVLLIPLLATCVHSTLNPNSKKSKKNPPDVKTNSGPVNLDVFERGLVDAEPQSLSIIQEANTYYRETSLKNFNGTVLGYLTPVIAFYYPMKKILLKIDNFSGTLMVMMWLKFSDES